MGILTSFDSVVLAAITVDLEPYIGGRIVRVIQPAADEVVLEIRRGRMTGRVLVSIHPRWARVHLTSTRASGSLSAFAQMLRRRLDGGVLRSIRQPPFERTLTFEVDTDGGPMNLAAEIMGRHSNLILVEEGKIAGSLKIVPRSKSSVREVLPGKPFTPVPRDRLTPLELSSQRLAESLHKLQMPLAKALAGSVLGLSATLAAELVIRSGLRPEAPADQAADAAERLWPHLQDLIATVRERRYVPIVYLDRTRPSGFAPFPFVHLESLPHHPVARMSDAVDAVLTPAGSLSRLEEARAGLLAAIDAALEKTRRTDAEVRKAIAEAEGAHELRAQGELLLAYASRIRPGAAEARLEGFDGQSMTIRLDPGLTAVENAQRLFKRYGKLRDALAALERRQQDLTADRTFLEEARALGLLASDEQDLTDLRRDLAEDGLLRLRKLPARTARRAGPRTFQLVGGTVLVGRTSQENNRVTFALASPEDLWFHARGVAGAHVILKSQARQPSPRLIKQAASIAAYFSQAWGSGQVPVDFTLRKYVRKPKGARPGLVTYEKEKTIFVKPELPATGQRGNAATTQ